MLFHPIFLIDCDPSKANVLDRFYGATVAQTLYYYRNFSMDSLRIKLFVSFVDRSTYEDMTRIGPLTDITLVVRLMTPMSRDSHFEALCCSILDTIKEITVCVVCHTQTSSREHDST